MIRADENDSSNEGASLSASSSDGCHAPNVASVERVFVTAPSYTVDDVLEPDEGYLDEPEDGDVPEGHAEPTSMQKFSQTGVGLVFGAGMLGLRDVLYGPKDEEPAIVEDWAGEPFDDPYVLRLDPEHPEDSIVLIRPHLMKKRETTD
jgi:hypothetical protein